MAGSLKVDCQPLSIGAGCEPSLDVRPRAFVCTVASHDADMATMDSIHFLVATAHFGKQGF